jgi:hypothetical protein
MLNLLLHPIVFSGTSLILISLAIYLSPRSYLSKYLMNKARENGKAGIYFPLFSSVIVSFVLTVIFKIFQI